MNFKVKLSAILLLNINIMFGQYPCVNEVSTDPNMPTNNSLPGFPSTSNLFPELYLNNFNWYDNTSGVLNQYPTNNMLNLPYLPAIKWIHPNE